MKNSEFYVNYADICKSGEVTSNIVLIGCGGELIRLGRSGGDSGHQNLICFVDSLHGQKYTHYAPTSPLLSKV